MIVDPFETLIAEQMVAATKRKLEQARKRAEKKLVVQSEADAPMKLGVMEQKLADVSKQMQSYRVIKRAEYEAMKSHPEYSARWSEFIRRVMVLRFDGDNSDFIDYFAKQQWLFDAKHDIRTKALAFVANRLMNLRIENGLAPFDDALPGEEPTLFETVRDQLKVMT